ncbi:hypothetical protein [Bosea sp. 685]|uniref:hypothetical protein n=1 Tax=Bosea sp. 685 TaxID=3080057 RepID=UPI002892C680|nr:hypothetical protein [Bosea sp. 685]WNJ88779.1 hypothetical protein RMR04_20495 [Bosea sp. 685]
MLIRFPAFALLALATLAVAPAPAMAQVIGEPIPGQSTTTSKATPWKPNKTARPCPEYGPGFVRMEGSTACVRLGGSVAVEYGVRTGGRSGSAATAGVRLETRDQTTLGPVSTVIQARGRIDRGLDGYAYGYR